MSSLRNAVKRITHKERSQPVARQHLGILEKKKDYKKRSKHYHAKEDYIRNLSRKAAMKNPDEYYFGMKNSQMMSGKHLKTTEAVQKELEDVIGHDAVRIMKEQDLAYIRMQANRDRSKIKQLESSLHYIGATVESDNDGEFKTKNKHTIFVDTKAEADQFDLAEHFDTFPELVCRSYNRPRASTVRKTALLLANDEEDVAVSNNSNTNKKRKNKKDIQQYDEIQNRKLMKRVVKERNAAYRELEQRRLRLKTLKAAEHHLTTEKLLAAKGTKRKIKQGGGADNAPTQYKWKRIRKR